MKYGFVLPYGDAHAAVEMAAAAEQAGWDGFFVWEPVWGYDAWILLAAAAMVTERIRLGTMISPLSRMRPWKLASETVTLDHLSGGRVILAVGLGALETGFAKFGEETDRRQRAELLDEGLEIVTGLWDAQHFAYQGKHYRITSEESFIPPPPTVQRPRIPIWVVGAWPWPKSMARAMRYDGILPVALEGPGSYQELSPEHVRAIQAHVVERRDPAAPFDIVVEGETPGDDPLAAAAHVQPWVEAGATWWIEARWNLPRDAQGHAAALERVQQGPPR